MAKHLFVTGGVVSSLGKGLTCAALGRLLISRGLKVKLQKFDPYINVDPGTMSPFQHGEVFVTVDGAETDLDLGHYERFTGIVTTQDSNFTSGTIYEAVINKERRGDYLGGTVQVVPHVTDEIKDKVRRLATREVDVVITEVGGTVGDIESLPVLEAIRQFGLEAGRGNVLYIHLTLVPYLRATGETKTKPTQHSVGRLREIGIIPDVLICRTEKPLAEEQRRKIALFCNVATECVIEEQDLLDRSIYELPVILEEQGLEALIMKRLRLRGRRRDLGPWKKMLEVLRHPTQEVDVAVVGKYIRLQSAYESVYEALTHGGIANRCRVRVHRVESEDVERVGAEALLRDMDGILVPGGFGIRGTEGKVAAITYARTSGTPYFGLCLGMQCAVIEFARNVCGLRGANSSEFNPHTRHPVIALMGTQRRVRRKGGTMRLGQYPCVLAKGTRAAEAYRREEVRERHRHRYEFNNRYRELFARHGMVFSGICPEGDLVEIVELADHPWFLAVQFHPEFQSTPLSAHPLFAGFIAAALARRAGRKGQAPPASVGE
jgi:CTP synthase